MNALVLLVALTSTIILQSGDRIVADGPVKEERGRLTFRVSGVLYSLPAEEVLRVDSPDEKDEAGAPVKRLKVSEAERKRLIEELANNHSGTVPPRPAILDAPPPGPTAAEVREQKRAEAEWRRDARAHEETMRRASEELELLETKAEELRWKISGLVSLGYRPHQFTYDTTQLAQTEEQLPYARLQVERARRAYEQFREDARSEGIMPGWVR
jgi:hypothetical protein